MRFQSLSKTMAAALTVLAFSLAGCSTSVTRMNASEVKDLSGAWNDTDSQLVAAEMMKDVLSREWIDDFKNTNNRKPAVIVGEVRNLSDEHISVSAFIQELQRNLINSGKVIFVASSTERKEIRGERADQDINASEATRKAMGKEKGADFMLQGTINTIIDVGGSDQLRYYQVNLTLISLSDNVIVWNGEKKIKKMIERSRLRF
ncbi:MAG: putative lipoprotein [Candidatus Gallionella acididurans]|uniref:Putative lipoprotein n=1 Tax=Candidatus Gallionella acididurans TaxID=1796491 RepID=A0A139BW19_9PROT|nr:MAG: putative lipoprotein [Candidatus Gallionella acididurans]